MFKHPYVQLIQGLGAGDRPGVFPEDSVISTASVITTRPMRSWQGISRLCLFAATAQLSQLILRYVGSVHYQDPLRRV
jgi:hypothetical protein